MNKTIDFIIVNYESFDLADLLVKSIFKYTKPYKYHIYLIDNSDQEVSINNKALLILKTANLL